MARDCHTAEAEQKSPPSESLFLSSAAAASTYFAGEARKTRRCSTRKMQRRARRSLVPFSIRRVPSIRACVCVCEVAARRATMEVLKNSVVLYMENETRVTALNFVIRSGELHRYVVDFCARLFFLSTVIKATRAWVKYCKKYI